jgi:branched-subunit amino acid aminotransferase/4-amino-4-deoxychorismate lyase
MQSGEIERQTERVLDWPVRAYAGSYTRIIHAHYESHPRHRPTGLNNFSAQNRQDYVMKLYHGKRDFLQPARKMFPFFTPGLTWTKPMKVYINGALYAERDAKISILDDSFSSGRGIREHFVCREGTFFHLDERLEYLKTFAAELKMEFPWPLGDIKEALASTYDMNKFNGGDALLTLIISAGASQCCCAGSSEKGKRASNEETKSAPEKAAEEAKPAQETKPTEKAAKAECGHTAAVTPSLIVLAKAHSREEPVNASLVSLENFPLGDKILQWERYTIGKLGTFLAQAAARQKAADGAILADTNGIICGCTKGDLFAISGKDIFTPALDRPWLPGKFLHPILPEAGDMKVTEKQLRLQDLSSTSECFLIRPCGKVVPVVKVNDTSVGDGNTGPITKIIATCLPQKMKNECRPAF